MRVYSLRSHIRTCPSILLIVILLSSATVLAQTHAIFTGLGTQPSSVSDFDVTTETVIWEMPRHLPLANWVLYWSPAITGDGRFSVWPAIPTSGGFVGGYVVRDLRTGAMNGTIFPPSLVFPLDGADIVVAHPRRLVMYFMLGGGSVLITEPTGYRRVASCSGRPIDATITLDGALLFIACADSAHPGV